MHALFQLIEKNCPSSYRWYAIKFFFLKLHLKRCAFSLLLCQEEFEIGSLHSSNLLVKNSHVAGWV